MVVGERRMAVFDDVRKTEKLQVFDKHIEMVNGQFVVERPTPEAVSFDADEPLLLECRHFMECVETRRTPKTDGHDAWRVLRVMEASQRSLSMNGEPVQLEAHRSWSSCVSDFLSVGDASCLRISRVMSSFLNRAGLKARLKKTLRGD